MRLLYTLLAVLTMGIASAQSDPYPANTGGNYSVLTVECDGSEYFYIYDAREDYQRPSATGTTEHYATTSTSGGPEAFIAGDDHYIVVGEWSSYNDLGDAVETLGDGEWHGWYTASSIEIDSGEVIRSMDSTPSCNGVN